MTQPTPSQPTPRSARFEALFEACHRPLLAYAARRCASLTDAEDAVADTFLVAWRRLDQVPDGDAALLWLYGVARRTIGNQRRGDTRRTRLVARIRDLGRGTSVEAAVEEAAPSVSVDHPAMVALTALSPADQELLKLVAWEELSHAEIAEVLGISVNAVAIRLHRARARFEDAMVKGPDRWRTWTAVKGSMSRRAPREKT